MKYPRHRLHKCKGFERGTKHFVQNSAETGNGFIYNFYHFFFFLRKTLRGRESEWERERDVLFSYQDPSKINSNTRTQCYAPWFYWFTNGYDLTTELDVCICYLLRQSIVALYFPMQPYIVIIDLYILVLLIYPTE